MQVIGVVPPNTSILSPAISDNPEIENSIESPGLALEGKADTMLGVEVDE